jgi:hypothetical protein
MFTILTTKKEVISKISQKGMYSLSDEEKDFLDKKSKGL